MVDHTLILNSVNYGVPQVVHAVYGDTCRELLIMLGDVNISGATGASVNFTRADNTYYHADGVISGSTITVPMEQMLTCVGETHCNLAITFADGTVRTFEFIVNVHIANGGSPATPEEGISFMEVAEEVKHKQDSLAGTAEASLQTGNSTAGAKGWYFSDWMDLPDSEYQVVIYNADGTNPNSSIFTTGDILSCKAGFSANYALEVIGAFNDEAHDGRCTLQVKYTDNFKMLNAPSTGYGAFNPSAHLYPTPTDGLGYIWNPEKPDAGTVIIGYGAMAIGYENKANEMGALAIGADNEVDGRYALANGQNNKVAYGSTALGHNNNVYGYDAFASGSYITLRNWRTTGFGQANSMNAVNGFVSGHGNNATTSAHDGISIRGTYAITQNTDTFIDVVGGGTDNDHRANAAALTPAGNYRLRGDVFVGCAANSSGGTNLRTAIEGKEDKGTYTLIDETTVTQDGSGDIWIYLSRTCRCVLVWISFPRTATENFRVYANAALNQNGGQIAVTAGSTGVTNAKIKFDATHGILESEWAKQEGLGGYVSKTTYAGFENEPVVTDQIESIIIRNVSNNILRAGTKIKIYGY